MEAVEAEAEWEWNYLSPDPRALLEALQPVFKLKSIRPVYNLSTPTLVYIDFIMFGILGVDEKTQVLTTFIWQFSYWLNEFVSWDPDQCGSPVISIPRTNLWVPDIVMNEFMEKNSAPFVPYTYLYSDGLVYDDKPVKVVSSCRLDIYKFPFDVQNCSFSFNSYLHLMSDVQLTHIYDMEERLQESKEVMATMGEWELLGFTMRKNQYPTDNGEPYQELQFHVSVRRRATLYVVNLLIPSGFLITVDLFSFLLPPKSVDRSLFKMTLILGYTMFLLIMSDLLPVTGNTIPLINVFLSMCLALMVASLLETILVTNLLCGSAHFSAVPPWLQLTVLHLLGHLVMLPPKSRKKKEPAVGNPEEVRMSSLMVEVPGQEGSLEELRGLRKELQKIRMKVEEHVIGSQSSKDWIHMGLIIDRLLFILYVLFIIFSFISIIVIWIQSHNPN
ncbi:5-hydroxytryptamine receptor 3A-like [Sphaeramia orbicularis]|uniref:5-hydroxytryptamine receptor 3A-like n=1 Tax=Sphaeramia orbicularis TaxID=375764 RepID=UPI00117C2055|nr:5-hydroxytryptamine receptor 3A-like [Sphaeramia orbicularis]